MPSNLNLKEIENKAFKSTNQDGLIDILIGSILSMFAIAPLLTDLGLGDFWSSFIFLPVYLICFLLFRIAKMKITVPRIGLMQIGDRRKIKLMKLIFFFSILLLLGIVAGLFFWAYWQKELVRWIAPAVLITLMLSSFSVAGYLLSISRLFIYGIKIALLVPIGEILFWRGIVTHHGYPLVFGISCSTMITTGIVLLIRFVRKYPKETADGKI
jgi:hypothetical protein